MSHNRRFCDGLLVALEESLVAFSGVNPDLIDAPATIPNTCCRDGGRFGSSVQTSAPYTSRRDSKALSETINKWR
jgi:hypothetical protein